MKLFNLLLAYRKRLYEEYGIFFVEKSKEDSLIIDELCKSIISLGMSLGKNEEVLKRIKKIKEGNYFVFEELLKYKDELEKEDIKINAAKRVRDKYAEFAESAGINK